MFSFVLKYLKKQKRGWGGVGVVCLKQNNYSKNMDKVWFHDLDFENCLISGFCFWGFFWWFFCADILIYLLTVTILFG